VADLELGHVLHKPYQKNYGSHHYGCGRQAVVPQSGIVFPLLSTSDGRSMPLPVPSRPSWDGLDGGQSRRPNR
jgi:hypothetical protein